MRIGGDRWILAAALVLVVGWPALATIIEATHLLPERICDGEQRLGAQAGPGAMVDPGSALSTPVGPAMGTIELVLATSAIALPIGIPLAFLLFRTDVWGRKGLLALVLLV